MLLELDEYKTRFQALKKIIDEVENSLGLKELENELKTLQEQMNTPGFWSDQDTVNKVGKRNKLLENKIARFTSLKNKEENVITIFELMIEEEDAALLVELKNELAQLESSTHKMRLELLLKGPHDANNAVMSLHAGAGGTEAQDWVSMLYRMYTRHCERQGWSVRILDYLDGEEAGIKSVSFEVDGENAYGYLKAEAGVHRLVRISPFDSSGRRHTSFASVDVTPIFEGEDNSIIINPDDLRIDTYRSSGAGGQHVNTTDSAIRITHLPTNTVVQCQNERSQIQNKETAMRMLRGKLAELKERENIDKMSELKGEMKRIEWGSQIRSYVFQPYTMVKDHRTGTESGNIDAVMDGDISSFIDNYLAKS